VSGEQACAAALISLSQFDWDFIWSESSVGAGEKMKTPFITLTIATSLTLITTANAWLGDSEPTLVKRFGSPHAVEISTSDIPTKKGFYVELTEAFTTNISLIASTNNDYNLNLVETRQRDSFTKDGLNITVYVGNVGEQYNGVDFSGASVREVINCPLLWQKNSHRDNVGRFMLFSPSAINTLLENNKGDSTWVAGWHPLFSVPGIYIKRTADKSRLAIGYGVSENEIHRLEFRMVDQNGNPAD
jgi:hypothetical protein